MDFREIVWKGGDRMHLVQNRDQWQGLVNTAMHLQVPQREGIS